MQELLRLNREVLDGQLPVLGLKLGPDALKTLTEAYANVGNLLAILEGKWRLSPPTDAPIPTDAKSIKFATQDFENALRETARSILKRRELKKAGLEITPAQADRPT